MAEAKHRTNRQALVPATARSRPHARTCAPCPEPPDIHAVKGSRCALGRHHHAATGNRTGDTRGGTTVRALLCEVIAPAVTEAAHAGFTRAFGCARITRVAENLLAARLPRPAAGTDAAATAGRQAAHAVRVLIRYLQHAGITSEQVLYPPEAVETLVALFAAFPDHAPQDDFARRWLIHAAGYDRYGQGAGAARGDVRAVCAADSYEAALAALAARAQSGAIPPLSSYWLHAGAGTRQCLGRGATLFALAARDAVSDLSDPTVHAGDTRLQLRPLWPSRTGRAGVAELAWMTGESAEIIHAFGGWGPAAYEALGCSDQTLAAQAIPRPSGLDQHVATLITARAEALIEMINDLLTATDPLLPGPAA
jgi:hypothetical protein